MTERVDYAVLEPEFTELQARFLDVMISILSRRTLNTDDLLRFQRIAAFVGLNGFEYPVTTPENN